MTAFHCVLRVYRKYCYRVRVLSFLFSNAADVTGTFICCFLHKIWALKIIIVDHEDNRRRGSGSVIRLALRYYFSPCAVLRFRAQLRRYIWR